MLLLQTFDFDKPGIMVGLEREACLSFYNHHFPDRVSLPMQCAAYMMHMSRRRDVSDDTACSDPIVINYVQLPMQWAICEVHMTQAMLLAHCCMQQLHGDCCC